MPATLAEKLTPAFRYRAVINRVIDGDTLVLDWDMGDDLWQRNKRARLLGINAPELHGATADEGKAARDYLEQLLCSYYVEQLEDERLVVIIETRLNKTDAFNRLLVRLWGRSKADGSAIDLNAKLIADGYAVPYREG